MRQIRIAFVGLLLLYLQGQTGQQAFGRVVISGREMNPGDESQIIKIPKKTLDIFLSIKYMQNSPRRLFISDII